MAALTTPPPTLLTATTTVLPYNKTGGERLSIWAVAVDYYRHTVVAHIVGGSTLIVMRSS